MKSFRVLLWCCICLGAYALLDASPAHAAVESAGLFDRATQHFQKSLTKWGDTMTSAATALFWMLATVAFCWEFGNLALRGGSMEAALAYVLRFVLIEGIWLFILQNAVPIGTAIIDSLRQIGSTASGLPKDLMPSAILDVGFGVLWKAITFVGKNTLTAPIVSAVALVMALLILLACAITAINMVVLIVSQWFLLYGGVFFLGFGGAPWTRDNARNYLTLALSVGAQLLGMAGVTGLGQSFIQAQYAQMSGDTSFGELAVILMVALLMCLLSNEIPKLFTRFAPGYAPQGMGIASLLGATATAAAAVAASAAMAKGAAESVGGMFKAASAAHSAAAKVRSSQSLSTPRSQTGVSSMRLGSIGSNGTSAGDSGERAGMRTQGPLGSMFGGNGIDNSRPGIGDRSASKSRSSTQAAPTEERDTAASKSTASHPALASADEKPASARTDAQATPSAGGTDSSATSQTPRASTQAEAQAQHGHDAMEREQDAHETSEAHSGASGAQHAEEEARTDSGDHDDHEDVEPSNVANAHNDTGSADDEAGAPDESNESERAQNAGTGSNRSRSPSEDEVAKDSSDRGTTATRSEPASTTAASNVAPTGGSESSAATASATPTSTGAATATAAGPTGAADTAHASSAPQSAPSSPTSSSSTSGATDHGSTPKKAATSSSKTGSGAADSTTAKTGAAPAGPKASSDVESAAAPAASSPASSSGSDSGSAPPEPIETTPMSGGGRGSTSIGTLAAATKILGEQTLQHYQGRYEKAKSGFSARADQTAGGRIAQAIRKQYKLDLPPKQGTENELRPLRSHTGAGKPVESDPHPIGHRTPADWVTGDEPMTENQCLFLQRRLGDEVDPNMTKAEASILIEELLNDKG